ncbi:MAG TPA: phosphotransferase, partial [Gemmatimonadales bacterium]|nr:phosphotransferase [Gemmatimonadales bacterium]
MSDVLAVRFQRPRIGTAEAAELALERFGLRGVLDELPSERDRNFRITTPAGERYVLKLAHADESPEILDLQHRALERIAARAPQLTMPRLVRSLGGQEADIAHADSGIPHLARVLTWVPGREWARCSPQTPELL